MRMSKRVVKMQRKLDVPEDKLNEYKEAFNKFDKSRSGYITANDICKIFKNYGNPIPKSEIEKMVKQIDTSGDGSIDFDEFVSLMEQQVSIVDNSDKCFQFSVELLKRMNDFRRDPTILYGSLQKFIKGVERVMKNDKEYLKELVSFQNSLRNLKKAKPLEKNFDLCNSAKIEISKYYHNPAKFNKYQDYKTLKSVVPDFYLTKNASLLGCDGFDLDDVDSTLCKLLLNKEDKFKKGKEMILNNSFTQAGLFACENDDDTYLIIIFADEKPDSGTKGKNGYLFTGKYLFEGAFPTFRQTNYRDLDNYKRTEVTVMSKPKMIYSYYHNPNQKWIELIEKGNEDFEEIKKRNIPGYKTGHPYGKFEHIYYCAPIRPKKIMLPGKSSISFKCLSPDKIIRKNPEDLIGKSVIISSYSGVRGQPTNQKSKYKISSIKKKY